VVGASGIKKVIELELTDEEKNKIEKVKEEFKAIKEIYP
jgi:malate/lactate dehydrogenase